MRQIYFVFKNPVVCVCPFVCGRVGNKFHTGERGRDVTPGSEVRPLADWGRSEWLASVAFITSLSTNKGSDEKEKNTSVRPSAGPCCSEGMNGLFYWRETALR